MSRIRIYIKPFDINGVYTTYQEVTECVDASSISKLRRSIDSTEYDVGVIKINSFSITMSNEEGRFSDIDSFRSMFKYKRSDSLIKIIWDINDYELQCGAVNAGAVILTNDEAVTLFEGIINDEGTSQGIKDQKIKFKCFGLEYLFKRMIVPYSDISNGDTMEELILALVDQSPFSDLVTVSSGNISVGSNVTIDDKSYLENGIVSSALEDILLVSNATLYIEDNVLYVSPREESTENQYTFYGQASVAGIENIESIDNFRSGLHRVFNHWTWDDTSLVSADTTSIGLFGVRTKDIGLDIITNGTSRQTVLDGLRGEFSSRKRELTITTKFNHERLGLSILDKINIDYPTIAYPASGGFLPVYGVSIYGEAEYPLEEFAFSILPDDYFKIIAIDYDMKSERIYYKVREI